MRLNLLSLKKPIRNRDLSTVYGLLHDTPEKVSWEYNFEVGTREAHGSSSDSIENSE